MSDTVYTIEKARLIKDKYRRMIRIVEELENEFPDRHFTLDGHLIGSIGEVMAACHYGINLYTASKKKHDGYIGNRKVQIKITQQDDVVISSKPQYLLVLYLTKMGDVYEVYNGPGRKPWEVASNPDSHNNCHIRINRLMELDQNVPNRYRIEAKEHIEKMKKEYKNRKKVSF